MSIPNDPYSSPGEALPGAAPSGYGEAGPAGSAAPTMPRRLRVVRVLLFIVAGLSILAGVAVGVMAASLAGQAAAEGVSLSMVYAESVLAVVLGVGELILALRFESGGNGVRVTTLAWGVLAVLGGVSQLPKGVIDVGLGGVVVATMLHPEVKAWFQRPRSGALGSASVNHPAHKEES